MSDVIYVCTQIQTTPYGVICMNYIQQTQYSSFKLTNEQMAQFIFAIALIHATVFAIKAVKRSFF